MVKKKVRKKFKIIVLVGLFILLAFVIYKSFTPKSDQVKETKIVSKIDKYDYKLKENKSDSYKKRFKELEDILKAETVDEEQYAKKVAELFIDDFYSLEDKEAKTDVGGVDFIYSEVLENFLQNAQNTYYKYVESNIYNNRNQKLPKVDTIEITNLEKVPFAYGSHTDEAAYKISVNWTYTSEDFAKYQNSATLILIHDEHKLSLVELQ